MKQHSPRGRRRLSLRAGGRMWKLGTAICLVMMFSAGCGQRVVTMAVDSCSWVRYLDMGESTYVQGSDEYLALSDADWMALRHRKVNILRPDTALLVLNHNDAWLENCEGRR